jgi:hypothetical protein
LKPFCLPVRIPSVTASSEFGAIAGSVVQAETGDAMRDATVDLKAKGDTKIVADRRQLTDAEGGFAFDNVPAGSYRLQVRKLGERRDTAVVRVATNRVDTVRFGLRAYRCYGY